MGVKGYLKVKPVLNILLQHVNSEDINSLTVLESNVPISTFKVDDKQKQEQNQNLFTIKDVLNSNLYNTKTNYKCIENEKEFLMSFLESKWNFFCARKNDSKLAFFYFSFLKRANKNYWDSPPDFAALWEKSYESQKARVTKILCSPDSKLFLICLFFFSDFTV